MGQPAVRGGAVHARPGHRLGAERRRPDLDLHLREGVTFHDGEPLTADAVVQSIQAAKERAGASFIWLPLDTVTATDATTVTMTLKYAAPMDLVASSLYGAWIVSPKALAAAAADEAYFEAGIDAGTGPYTIESYTPDKEVLLTAYDGYWGATDDIDHYDKVLISITPEAVTQQQMLDGGDVDLALSLPLENIDSYSSNPDFTFIEEPSFFNYVGYFNVNNKPLDDVRVRQALSWAIPYDDIVTVGAQGYGTQSRGPVPAGVFPYDASVPQYTQDLDKARQLLTEAGYEGGGFDLELTYASENQNETRFAPLIKEAYAEIGVNVTLTPMLFSQQWERSKGDPAVARTCSWCSTGRPTATPAPTTCGPSSTAARPRSSTCPTGTTPNTTSWSTTPAP